MNNIDLMEYWFKSADEDYDTMLYMKASKKNTWCLFMGHKELLMKNAQMITYLNK